MNMKNGFLYQQIALDIRSKIENESYQAGALLDSPDTLSQRYSASTVTVNKALLALAEEGYIKRIPGKGSVVNAVQKRGLSPLVGAIVYDMAQSDIWASMLRGVESSLFQLDYQLLVGNDFGNQDRMVQYIDRFAEQGARGLIIVPLSGYSAQEFADLNGHVIDHLEKRGLPFVILHRVLPQCKTIQVAFDNLEDAVTLTHALLAQGMRSPFLISHRIYNSVIAERERGYCEALAGEGFKTPADTIVRIPQELSYAEGELTAFGQFLAAQIACHPEVDTVIAVDNQILTLLNATLSAGLLAGAQTAYSGFGMLDESVDEGTIGIYQSQNPANLGELAVEALIDLIESDTKPIPHILRVPSTLVTVSKRGG